MKFGQVQTSEVLPLGENDTAMVAVLLTVSSTSTTDEAGQEAAPETDGPSPAGVRYEREPFSPPSTLERYVADMDVAFAGLRVDGAAPAPDWRGIKIWLAYRPNDLAAVLKRPRKKPYRGRRP